MAIELLRGPRWRMTLSDWSARRRHRPASALPAVGRGGGYGYLGVAPGVAWADPSSAEVPDVVVAGDAGRDRRGHPTNVTIGTAYAAQAIISITVG
jgi:hypothetical protein